MRASAAPGSCAATTEGIIGGALELDAHSRPLQGEAVIPYKMYNICTAAVLIEQVRRAEGDCQAEGWRLKEKSMRSSVAPGWGAVYG